MKTISVLALCAGWLLGGSALAAAPTFKCLGVKIAKVEIGTTADYEAKEGLATKKYGGFINRRAAKAAEQCLINEANPGETVVLWFDKKSFETATKGTSMYPGVQCVFVDDGKELAAMDSPSTDAVAGKDLLTKCPNETGYDCDAGSNSERNSKYREQLDKQKLVMHSVYLRPNSNMMASPAAKKGEWDGREVFCQAFDKKSGKVLYAVQYKVGPAPAAKK